jgi:DNA-binding transcriptional MerR regulator
MLILDSIEPEKWYKVREVSRILGWSEDVVRRWINRGLIQAFILPQRSSRPRVFRAVRIQGCEIIRFAKEHLTGLKNLNRVRFRELT